MITVGITGGTGAGKTTVLETLRAMGALVLDCDAVYHRLLEHDDAMRGELEARFGPLGQGAQGRQTLGRAVFRSPEALGELNRITHRYVLREVRRLLEAHRTSGGRLAAIDAIALFESGLDHDCDFTVAVTAPEEERAQRIMRREGISREYALLRIAAQKPDGYFRERCTMELVNNTRDAAAFAGQSRELLEKMVKRSECEKMDELKKKLLYERQNASETISAEESQLAESYCAGYKWYLDRAKTEREAVQAAIALAEDSGFVPFDTRRELKPGDRIYRNLRGKSLILAVVGKTPAVSGVNIAAAHVDAPRLDLKPVPLYEDNGLALFKTHYYGGIRKYQWVTIPLELHGVVVRSDGEKVQVSIGGDPTDPVFVITDLLPHLAGEQNKKTLAEGITGEELNVFAGSYPVPGEGSDRVRLNVMRLLNEKYGITEEDFLSAELEIVPAFRARDLGFDRSLIGAYGHDDRVCAYAELMALLDQTVPEKTAVCILADKEEIGSCGATGMQSQAFELFMGDLCGDFGEGLRRCFDSSFCLSADVTNAFDPTFASVSEKRNNAAVNAGIAIAKYTGSRGKSGCSDANAESMGRIRSAFAHHAVTWQTAEMGKVDQGGGGTVAVYMANRNIETVDAGVPVLSMHAPYEAVAKLDCYMTYKGVKALYADL